MSPHDLFGFALLCVQASLLWPLLRHSCRTRDIAGVSPVGEGIWVVGGAGWLLYGLLAGSPVLIISGTLICIGSSSLLLLTRASIPPASLKRAWVGAGVTVVALSVSGYFFGLRGLSAALAVFGMVQFLPQLTESATRILRRLPEPGVSPAASAFRSFYAGLWALYGAGAGDLPIVTWGLAGAMAFALQALNARLVPAAPREKTQLQSTPQAGDMDSVLSRQPAAPSEQEKAPAAPWCDGGFGFSPVTGRRRTSGCGDAETVGPQRGPGRTPSSRYEPR